MHDAFKYEFGSCAPEGKFDQVFYLGWLPQAADDMRRYWPELIAAPFDKVIAPFASLQLLFGKAVVSVAEFLIPTTEGLSCASTGIFFQKDFPPFKEGLFQFTAADLDACRDRMRRDMAALFNACNSGRRTLFVRFEGQYLTTTGEPTHIPTSLSSPPDLKISDINAFVSAIQSMFPTLNFHLFTITPSDQTIFIADAKPVKSVTFTSLANM